MNGLVHLILCHIADCTNDRDGAHADRYGAAAQQAAHTASFDLSKRQTDEITAPHPGTPSLRPAMGSDYRTQSILRQIRPK